MENVMLPRYGFVVGFLACGSVAAWAAAPKTDEASAGYHVRAEYPIGGPGGWDYLVVDAAARRLYVSHATHVVVLDADSGKRIGDIPDTSGVHGVALAEEFGRGFTSNGANGTSTIFDLKTLKKTGSVKTGLNPDAILFDPFTKRVFVFNAGSNDVTVIDASSGIVVGTTALRGSPEAAVSDGKGTIFVNIEDTSEVVRIDARHLTVTARWSLSPGEEPSGLALDAANRRLFAVCANEKMVVVDADSGAIVTTLPIGGEADGAAFDPATGNAYSSNGDGSLTVVHERDAAHFTIIQTVPTRLGARTLALDPVKHEVFLATARFDPSAGTPGRPRALSDSFAVLVVGR